MPLRSRLACSSATRTVVSWMVLNTRASSPISSFDDTVSGWISVRPGSPPRCNVLTRLGNCTSATSRAASVRLCSDRLTDRIMIQASTSTMSTSVETPRP